jgi:hypothetical protein
MPGAKLLSYCTEIFTGDALHWFRAVQDQVSCWEDLVARLKDDFDQADYDYRLLSEIRARTQGESENITIYMSIMAGLFSRLSKSLSNDDKLEILLHNIRPCYASTLASVPKISDVDTLRSLCRNYESIQARLVGFHEPPKVSSGLLAPEFAYAGQSSNKFSHGSSQSFNRKPYSNFYDKNKNNEHTGPYTYNAANKSYTKNNNSYIHAVQHQERKSPYCPRCRDNTHNIRQCKANKDRVFCFVCGHEGVKSPDCPKCGKGNPSTSKNE